MTENIVATLCGGSVDVRETGQCYGQCGKPDARRIVSYADSMWYSPSVYCECGDGWGDGELFARPFARGWRAREQARFEKRWAAAYPEGSRPDYDRDCMLREVIVPDTPESSTSA